MKTKGKKIAFCYEDPLGAFIGPTAAHFSKDNDIRVFKLEKAEDLNAVLSWADVSWFDFCTMGTIFASQEKRKSKIVCRLHSFETFMPFPKQVNWDNVDALVFVAEHVRKRVSASISTNGCRVSVIENGVDPSLFPFRDPSLKERIGFVGPISSRKNLPMALWIFHEINKRFNGSSLSVCGEIQDIFLPQYMEKFPVNLETKFLGHQHSMTPFYRSVDFILSTSLWESFQYAIAEGILSGCVPLIHRWEGASAVWPEEFIFGSVDEAVELFSRNRVPSVAKAKENRNFVIERFGINRQMRETDALLSEVLA